MSDTTLLSVLEYVKEVGKVLGFDIDKIYFSGFWSQGDGASWIGHYRYAKGAHDARRTYQTNLEGFVTKQERGCQ